MIIDYSESRFSVKVSDLSNTCALIIRNLPLFERLNYIYYEPNGAAAAAIYNHSLIRIFRARRVIYRIVFARLGVKEPKS
jgi:hypothetical protein